MGESFNERFRAGTQSGEYLLLPIFLIILSLIVIYILFKYLKNNNLNDTINKWKKSIVDNFGTGSSIDFTQLTPLQRKVLYDIIDEYKKKNYYSQNIADADYELFGEYLLRNTNRLVMKKNDVKLAENQHYPLIKGSKIEVDFEINEHKFIVETNVVDIDDKTVTAKYINIKPEDYSKGQKLTINYNISNLFISGESYIKSIVPGKEIILSRPKKLKLSNERRYKRFLMNNVKGTIYSSFLTEGYEVELLDLSNEGVKIRSKINLKKNYQYRLTFSEEIEGYAFEFENLLCYISKSFIASGGVYEYGMIFYNTIEEKFKLYNYLKRHVKYNSIKF